MSGKKERHIPLLDKAGILPDESASIMKDKLVGHVVRNKVDQLLPFLPAFRKSLKPCSLLGFVFASS